MKYYDLWEEDVVLAMEETLKEKEEDDDEDEKDDYEQLTVEEEIKISRR